MISWAEARSNIDKAYGTLVEEHRKDGFLCLWWTPDDVASISPHPCCYYEEGSMATWEEFAPFFEWCRARFTSHEAGTALLVDLEGNEKAFLTYVVEGSAGRRLVYVH